ncbi:MMPL family transporter [Alienimonas californiensis]|uniref:MMPL family protein n=1 Tax=Alienimonas californiensis TaxID=2527989 RepID=A0A517PD85_9PLAN|nr:MMPL family transporter [Alienimonas californiensis]QDT17340.1 MMPL family protein [Alienimonas californiensis]
MTDHAARRCALVLLLAAGACLPLFASLAADLPVNNDPETWLPADGPNRTAYDAFRRTFGSEEAILAAFPADTSPATVAALRVRIESSPRIQHACSPASIGAVMREMNVPEAEIDARLTGLLRGADGEWAAVAGTLSAAGAADRPAAVRDVRRAVAASGLAAVAKVAGVPVVVTELDRLSRPDAVAPYLAGMFALGLAVLRWVCGRWGLAALLGGTVVWATLGTLAGVRLAGGEMNLILAALPALVLVFALTASVHLLHYHAAAPGQGAAKALAAVRAAARPTAWATATTAAGLLSLGLSEVRPVAWFGPAGALGALLAAFGGLVLTPAAVMLCGGLGSGAQLVHHRWDWAGWTVRWRGAVLAVSAAAVAACSLGLPRLSAKVDAADLLPSKAAVAQDHRFVRDEITPAESLEIVVRPAPEAAFGETLATVRRIAADLNERPSVRHVASAALFLGEVDGFAAAGRMSAARSLPEAAAFVTADGSAWRLSVRADCPPGRRASVVNDLRSVCLRHVPIDQVTVTGLAPLLEAAEVAIYDGFRDSLVAATLLIALAVLFAVGDWRVWLTAGVANLVPLAAVFGLLGWAGRAVDVGMMMTASVALGLAVDGTFHLLVRHRAEVTRAGADACGARCAAAAAHAAGPAVMQAAAIAGAGVLALTASPFPPTARFGWLTAALLAAAILADLLILPALLAYLPVRTGTGAESAAIIRFPARPPVPASADEARRAA